MKKIIVISVIVLGALSFIAYLLHAASLSVMLLLSAPEGKVFYMILGGVVLFVVQQWIVTKIGNKIFKTK